ncbi:MAG: hypothetical protein HQK51_19125 [Oligoflexia bacterium]|nr:hypothetical protein [Oligoflexia bacterium]
MSELATQVFFSPLIRPYLYAKEVEVTDYLYLKQSLKISKSVESNDYSIGVYTFDDVELVGDNRQGFFNEYDYRSVFSSERDLCKVRITIDNKSVFFGLIHEEATRINFNTGQIRFKILSLDSIFLKTLLRSDVLESGDSVKNAVFKIFTLSQFSNLISFDINNINPGLNLLLDKISTIAPLNIKEFFDVILFASNSILWVADEKIKICGRDILRAKSARLHQFVEDEIIEVFDYNKGLHRVFNIFNINNTVVLDNISINRYGPKKKKLDVKFFTQEEKEKIIANALISEFAFPKVELKVKIPLELGLNVSLLDSISLSLEAKYSLPKGKFLPIVGATTTNDIYSQIPEFYNDIELNDSCGTVLEIEHETNECITTLKLRMF